MLTTLLLVSTLAGPPAAWADPFVPPVERFASYWPTRAAKAKPAPVPSTRLTRADFVEVPKPRALTASEARAQAEALASDLAADVATYLVLTDKRDRAVVLSAMLCESRQRAEDAAAKNRSGTLDRPLALAYVRAVEARDAAELRLAVLGQEPLACGLWPVERLTACLGLLPATECAADEALAAQVRAAERLERTP